MFTIQFVFNHKEHTRFTEIWWK